MTEPSVIRAGDSVAWSRLLPTYTAADGWQLSYRLLWPSSGAPVDFNASDAGGGDWRVSRTPAETASWAAGTATLVYRVERSTSERITIGAAPIQIQPNLMTATTIDGRSSARRALEDAKAALARYAGRGVVAEYEIAGRRVKFRSSAEIVALIDHYEREVANERRAARLLSGAGGRILVRG